MTKARSKAQKLADRRRRSAIDLPEIAETPKRKSRGRQRMNDIKHEHDADIPALQARIRQAGMTNDEKGMREAKAQWMGCSAGKAMSGHIHDEKSRAILWDAIQHMRRVQLAYDRALGAPSRHAECLRLMLPLDELSADASSPPLDVRTEDEKHRQAVSAWMAMHGWLSHCKGRSASICLRTVIDDVRCSDASAMVDALQCVADGIAGRVSRSAVDCIVAVNVQERQARAIVAAHNGESR